MIFDRETAQQMGSVLAIVAGALLFWLWIAFAARRMRRHLQTLLALAAQSRDPQSELAAAQRRLTALGILINAVKYFGAFSVAISLLLQLNVRLDSLLLPAGFLGAALGLGAQNFVRDIVAGFFLVFEGQFGVGDIVSLNGTAGTVEEVGLRVTRLRDEAGQVFYFPNGAITTVAKFPRRAVPLQIWLPMPPSIDTKQLEDILTRVLSGFDAGWDWQLLPLSHSQFAPAEATETPAMAPQSTLDAPNDESRQIHQMPVDSLHETPHAKSEKNSTSTAPAAAQSTLPATSLTPLGWQRFRMVAPPLRAAVLREKLPSHLSATLSACGLPTANGASIEVMPAPLEE